MDSTIGIPFHSSPPSRVDILQLLEYDSSYVSSHETPPHWMLAVYIHCDPKIRGGVLQRRLWFVRVIIPLRASPRPN